MMSTDKKLLPLFLVALLMPVSLVADSIEERFFKNENGTILDTETGNQWLVGPDVDTDWTEAHEWINSLEGDWRMPSKYDLWDLFMSGIDIYSWGPFDNSGRYVWAFDVVSTDMSFIFSFVPDLNGAFWARQWIVGITGIRAFAIKCPPIWRRLAQYTFRS